MRERGMAWDEILMNRDMKGKGERELQGTKW